MTYKTITFYDNNTKLPPAPSFYPVTDKKRRSNDCQSAVINPTDSSRIDIEDELNFSVFKGTVIQQHAMTKITSIDTALYARETQGFLN